MWDITLAILLVLVLLWLKCRRKQLSVFKELGIPGPKPNLLFGNLWELKRKTPIQCHKEWIEKYGKILGYYCGMSPVLIVADIELVKAILVKDFHNFTNRSSAATITSLTKGQGIISQMLIKLRDKRWKEIRKIITPSFTSSKMKMIFSVGNSAVDTLLEIVGKKARGGVSFDIYKLFQTLMMDMISRSALGINPDCQNNPDVSMFTSLKAIMDKNFSNNLSIIRKSFPELDFFWKKTIYLELVIRNNRRNPFSDAINTVKDVIRTKRSTRSNQRQDLLQLMIDAGIDESELNEIANDELTALDYEINKNEIANDELTALGYEINNQDKENAVLQNPGKRFKYMTEDEIVDNAVLFFLAGRSSTSAALAFTVHFLVHYPEVQQKIRNEITEVINKEGKLDYNAIQQLRYLDQVLLESMRIYPPVYSLVTRMAAEDTEYGSVKISKGMTVQIPVHYIHHDPDLWEEPEKFDPDRFSPENKDKLNASAFLAFGAGPRNCVAMRFAKTQLKIVLAKILEKYQLLPTEETEKGPLVLKFKPITIGPANGINLKIKPV